MASKTKDRKAKPDKRGAASGGKGKAKPGAGRDTVPESDENFEHTLRRLVIDKEKQRSDRRWMYL